MNKSAQADTGVHSIDLAQEADFDLGSLHVRPATCEVISRAIARSYNGASCRCLVLGRGPRFGRLTRRAHHPLLAGLGKR